MMDKTNLEETIRQLHQEIDLLTSETCYTKGEVIFSWTPGYWKAFHAEHGELPGEYGPNEIQEMEEDCVEEGWLTPEDLS